MEKSRSWRWRRTDRGALAHRLAIRGICDGFAPGRGKAGIDAVNGRCLSPTWGCAAACDVLGKMTSVRTEFPAWHWEPHARGVPDSPTDSLDRMADLVLCGISGGTMGAVVGVRNVDCTPGTRKPHSGPTSWGSAVSGARVCGNEARSADASLRPCAAARCSHWRARSRLRSPARPSAR